MEHNAVPEGSDDIWCVVPAYNNAASLAQVASACRRECRHVVVVDDGSTDADVSALLGQSDVTVLRHKRNMGKGQAILTALDHVRDHGGAYIVTIDADGQHDPRDLRKVVPLVADNTDTLVIGCRDFATPDIPGSSRFGRHFSDFWLRLETGVDTRDSQSGFRAYPVMHLSRIRTRARRYGFEVEALAKLLWAGLPLETVDISVSYPPRSERTSSFRPFADNARISLVHATLVARRLVPWPHRKLVRGGPSVWETLRHPSRFIRKLLRENTTPQGLAAAAAVGVFLGAVPLISLHTAAILYVCARLNLNKVMAVSIQSVCVPPLVPLLCIEFGHYMLHGNWLTEASREVLIGQLPSRLYEWFLGSLVVGPLLAGVAALCVFLLARAFSRAGGS